jgi:hypothetical protein
MKITKSSVLEGILKPKKEFSKRNNITDIGRDIFTSRFLISYLGIGLIWVVNLLTILRSSWAGDDWPNSQTPYWIKWRYGILDNWNIWAEAMFWNKQWMDGAGRFYPLTWIESRFIFSYFTEIWQYKLLQITALAFAGFLFTFVIFLLSKSHILAIFTLSFLSITVQFRRDFDPHLAFSLMLPSLLIKVLLAVLLAYYSAKSVTILKAFFLSTISGIFFFSAMSTYEFGFLLFPFLAFGFILGCSERKLPKEIPNKMYFFTLLKMLMSWRFVPILLSWIGYALFVFAYLRPRAVAISGVYVLGLSWDSLKVLISQIPLGMPFASLRISDLKLVGATFVIAIFLAYIFSSTITKFLNVIGSNSSRKVLLEETDSTAKLKNIVLIGIAFNLILAPGVMMSMQPTWWGRANLSNTYLGVMITEFGSALLLAIIGRKFLTNNLKNHQVRNRTK